MKKLYKVWGVIYTFIVGIIFEGKIKPKQRQKFDSRKINPPRCGDAVERILFNNYSEYPSAIPYIFEYSCKEVHSSIYWFKYRRDVYTTNLFARILFDDIIGQLSERFDTRSNINTWVISPAPSTSYIRGEKTWDHNQDLINEMKEIYRKNEKNLGLQIYFENIFTLNPESISAKKLSRNERLKSSVDKFKLKNSKSLNGIGLIIIDDVTTTGSTLKNLAKLSDGLNPKITLTVAIAH